MKICYVSHADSYHTIKWATNLASRGHDVHVLSLRDWNPRDYEGSRVTVHHLLGDVSRAGAIGKALYLAAIPRTRSLIESIDPDVVHAHRAPSNGLICALACDRPYYLSVWGEDIYNFPRKSPVHKAVVKHSLESCSWLLSTSRAMAQEALKYTKKTIEITPFGVDMDLFSPAKRARGNDGRFVVGTVKGLEPCYGISTLLKGCAALVRHRPEMNVEIRIAGRGSQEAELRALAKELNISSRVTWLGYIPQEQAAWEWANFDVGVIASESESFGVSAVECQACGTPLVITDVPGLLEACSDGETAQIVPRCDDLALADVVEALADNPSRRKVMGERGREYVESAYEIETCFRRVEELYERN